MFQLGLEPTGPLY